MPLRITPPALFFPPPHLAGMTQSSEKFIRFITADHGYKINSCIVYIFFHPQIACILDYLNSDDVSSADFTYNFSRRLLMSITTIISDIMHEVCKRSDLNRFRQVALRRRDTSRTLSSTTKTLRNDNYPTFLVNSLGVTRTFISRAIKNTLLTFNNHPRLLPRRVLRTRTNVERALPEVRLIEESDFTRGSSAV
ncbi:hypothetical protein PUN28_016156 [Cardiocondyla obscurior]|uniref:Uncharacterized protein n=1 Tax=Cardiocondyla obscurior TaxID=286306 RepID=A0AAW2EWH5_9HYME